MCQSVVTISSNNSKQRYQLCWVSFIHYFYCSFLWTFIFLSQVDLAGQDSATSCGVCVGGRLARGCGGVAFIALPSSCQLRGWQGVLHVVVWSETSQLVLTPRQRGRRSLHKALACFSQNSAGIPSSSAFLSSPLQGRWVDGNGSESVVPSRLSFPILPFFPRVRKRF